MDVPDNGCGIYPCLDASELRTIASNHSQPHTMTQPAFEILQHPELGELAARRLLDCVFALDARGRILHFHIEQMEVVSGADSVHYRLTDSPALPERTRCQIIPPFVPAFKRKA